MSERMSAKQAMRKSDGESETGEERVETGLDPRLEALLHGHGGDPFALLGPHATPEGKVRVRAMAQGAEAMALLNEHGKVVALTRCLDPAGLFEAELGTAMRYRLRIAWPSAMQEMDDPYAFGPVLEEAWLHGLVNGDGECARQALGAHRMVHEGVEGVRFAVWAPNAQRVSLVGEFNGWDGRRNPMRLRHAGGVWELFIPGLGAGARYKYEITAGDGTRLPHKADPMARQCEPPPATASVVPQAEAFAWTDVEWMAQRAARATTPEPIAVYEVHAGSWRWGSDGQPLDWDGLARELIPYVQWLGFTHIELLPITEYPFGGSWGYQPLGMYAPTARYGSPEGFARFVDACHNAGIGVVLDWVSAHFPNDEHGLERFDGTSLYEHADPREGFHKDWNTLIYNYGRHEVSAYLVGSALEWIERYHIDGLRVDAVASMLYRDYSRAEGEWVPNRHGGRENLEAVEFIKRLNSEVGRRFPGVMMIAEESTAWGGVTLPPELGGLGFTHKWNMGWMHDTLEYMKRDPVHRKHHHSEMTFGMVYAFSERFMLPLSHDEVVHGKGSLLTKMPGDTWQKLANLRAYFGFMWAHPGRKLLFMGGEFGQWDEWNHDAQLDWPLMRVHEHHGLAQLVSDLNARLKEQPALYRNDHIPEGFEWSVGDDHANSVFAFVRHDRDTGAAPVLAVSNFTPMPRYGYRVGVPRAGQWREILNTDSGHYGGSNVGNAGAVDSQAVPMHGHAQSLALTLPPLATIWLKAD